MIHADSAFSSVKTAKALLEKGLFFMGAVKTAHREFPKAYLQSFENEPRGSWKLLQSFKDGDNIDNPKLISSQTYPSPIFAMGWFDKKTQCVVSTCGSTIPGKSAVRTRHEVVHLGNGLKETQTREKIIPRPKLIETFFSCFSNIDVHDHYRQGSLKLEKSWNTHKWHHRCYATVVGMCVVDAFYAFKRDVNQGQCDDVDFKTFVRYLSQELVDNWHLDTPTTLRNLPQRMGASSEVQLPLFPTNVDEWSH